MDQVSIDPLLGRVIAQKLEILELLGVGAMGKVYRAKHMGLDKPVAIKVLLRMDGAAEIHARRFQAEARAASRLDHPNSVQILDFGEDADGLLYIAMEFLEGRDLQAILRREGRIETNRICWIMSQALSALSAAHSNGIIHRDMKPGNIMLIEKTSEDGVVKDFVKVCDFGLAKILDAGDSTVGPLTKQGAVFGTPAYMSPEQARGEPLDAMSDIYSCGVIMYKMVTGRTPFRAESPTGVLMKHISEEPAPMSTHDVTPDPRLDEVVRRAMAKDPKARFENAREMRDALRAILRDAGIEVPSMTGVSAVPAYRSSVEPRPVPRDSSRASTMFAQTVAGTVNATRPMEEAATLQTLPPQTGEDWTRPAATKTRPAAPAFGTTLIALIPGALALIAVGALGVFVWMDRSTNNATTAEPAQVAESQLVAEPPTPEPEPAIVRDAGVAPAEDANVVVEPPPKIETKRRRRKRKTSNTPSAEPSKEKVPEKIEPPPPLPVREAPPPKTAELLDPTKRDPRTVDLGVKLPGSGPAIPKRSVDEPKKLSERFRVDVTLDVKTMSGGISKNRSMEALQRHEADVQACVRRGIASGGVHKNGRITVKATISVQGRLRKLSASGLQGMTSCLTKAYGSARLPRPDTGEVPIEFFLDFSTRDI